MQRVLEIQHSLDISAEVSGISLRLIHSRASHRQQPVFVAPELLRKADGLCMRDRSSQFSGFQQDSVEWPNSLLFDGFYLAERDLLFPKASLYSNLTGL